MLKKKNKLWMQIVLLFWVYKTHTPILNGIVFSVTSEFFSRNQMETRQLLFVTEFCECVFTADTQQTL